MNITFPDGSIKEFDQGVSGYDIAMSISPRLAKEALGVKVNNDIWDLTRPIQEDSKISILKWDDPAGKMVFWHSSAHLMAEAIESVFPGTKFGIGPPIENGFYYDVDSGEKEITQADLEKLERKMKELQSEKSSYVREDISK
ncbi:MAG: TGS domain-containing protein, partial [Bacteroidetes bacterium]|nr:TGS domain-containing protein [Bacteroidota bacterium]